MKSYTALLFEDKLQELNKIKNEYIELRSSQTASDTDYQTQLEQLKVILDLTRTIYGIDHVECINIWYEMGRTFVHLKQYDQAMTHYQEVVTLTEHHLKHAAHRLYKKTYQTLAGLCAASYFHLGILYQYQNHLENAKKCFLKCIGVDTRNQQLGVKDAGQLTEKAQRRVEALLEETLDFIDKDCQIDLPDVHLCHLLEGRCFPSSASLFAVPFPGCEIESVVPIITFKNELKP